MKAVKISVKGKVQGVFFRASTKKKAQALSINGWCKNETDGSVLIYAEGGAAEIDRFIDWCKEGPELAIVKDFSVELVPKPLGFTDFEIRR
ncbi:MAG: acylphosphatase [Roseivirga sp.]|jgi:acylphosphatase